VRSRALRGVEGGVRLLRSAPEGGALASGVEWWQIAGARKDNSSEPEPG
jgi:hypothetical protein